MGPKYRKPRTIHIKQSSKAVRNDIDECIASWYPKKKR